MNLSLVALILFLIGIWSVVSMPTSDEGSYDLNAEVVNVQAATFFIGTALILWIINYVYL